MEFGNRPARCAIAAAVGLRTREIGARSRQFKCRAAARSANPPCAPDVVAGRFMKRLDAYFIGE